MSKIISELDCGIVSHVVQANSGNMYAVSSTKAFDRNRSPWETAVFRYNKRDKKITNWVHLYMTHDESEECMRITHSLVCANLEDYIMDERRKEYA